jgi:mRNA interferase RelE/StbE
MNTLFKKSFLKSIETINNKRLRESVLNCIKEVEQATAIHTISNIKKLKGHRDYYRIRIGNYRIGLKLESDVITFAVFEDRKDIYKNFP